MIKIFIYLTSLKKYFSSFLVGLKHACHICPRGINAPESPLKVEINPLEVSMPKSGLESYTG